MKYNWPAVVEEYRKVLIDSVSFVDENGKPNKDITEFFKLQVHETDTFHPFGTDKELDIALRMMPDRCNYRNPKSYWAWKHGKSRVGDAIFEMLEENREEIHEYFSEPWNFPPGYSKEFDIVFKDLELLTEKSIGRILRAARTPADPNRFD